MTATDVRTKVLDIIADIALDDDVTTIDDSVSLREQLDLDSMDFLDIVMELKKRHKVEVPQEDYPKLATMQSCVDYLSPKFQALA
ncbi:MAG: acyl carrier protein [Bdellovibrionales bacterium CG12_big_fil_rev_8_21_14_0_65_38_15]|nr:MAG: acyl carrier protein [Bdellovibrionales bacterium CG22_combo_CG10-13_8_21_14_all_38_13]PIQ55323.1 MAG: acyl carrier protein [Bdellovibrionales bacterium CG12_big_fil_rev_8_21_14_0_65_38_15]PIR28933.1 MAG: acyl carrier protein [Bdellovibrionales bacterium CG11_big_fil_rev_8_21_14_0_20_38_13]